MRPSSRRISSSAYPGVGFDRIMLQFKISKDVKDENGWAYPTKTGICGTDYLMRALVTAIGLGANRPQDAVYPTSLKDGEGWKYKGGNRYVMHFPEGQLARAGLLVTNNVRCQRLSS
jgi:hypothetical protein